MDVRNDFFSLILWVVIPLLLQYSIDTSRLVSLSLGDYLFFHSGSILILRSYILDNYSMKFVKLFHVFCLFVSCYILPACL